MTFGYVAALAARNGSSLSILDYGGNLGYFQSLAKGLLWDVQLDYHCKELPAMVRAGGSSGVFRRPAAAVRA